MGRRPFDSRRLAAHAGPLPAHAPRRPRRPPTSRGMHAANRAAWDEAAERYEGWFDEAVALIRSGGSNLFPVEQDLIGDLHGRCRRAIHLQCAGGRDTLSLWNLGAEEVVASTSARGCSTSRGGSPRRPAPRDLVEADVLETPHELDGTADLLYTGRGAILWLQDLDAWAAVLRRLLAPDGPAGHLRRPPRGVAVRRRRRWRLDADRLRLLRGSRGVPRLGARVHRPALGPRRRPALEVRPRVDAGRDRDRAARRRAPARARDGAPGRLVGGPPRRPRRPARPVPLSFSVVARRG